MSFKNVNYSDKKVLLVESNGNMRAIFGQLLKQLGLVNIQALSPKKEVLGLIRQNAYDIVLVGHNESDKFSGLQLLEEARYSQLMKPSTGWIFLTSDTNEATILHALDSQPDFLLAKPCTLEELRVRIDILLLRKQLLRSIEDALAANDLNEALAQCDAIPRHNPQYDDVILNDAYEIAQRLKGKLLLRLQRAEEALTILQERYWQKPDKETALLIGEAFVQLKQYPQAIEQFENIIEEFPLYIPAMDMLAKTFELTGRLEKSQEVLSEATKKAPLGIPRQMELGRIATETKTLGLAEAAFRRSIVLGKSSCYHSVDPYLRLANLRRLEAQTASVEKQAQLENEFEKLVTHAEKSFANDPKVKIKTTLAKSQFFKDIGNQLQAESLLNEAVKLNDSLEEPLNLDNEAILLTGKMIPAISEAVDDQPALEVEDQQENTIVLSDKMNRMAIRYYMEGKYGQAMRCLNMALEYHSSNGAVILNLAQLYLEVARDQPNKREDRINMVKRYIKLSLRVSLSEMAKIRRQELYELLKVPIETLPQGSLGVLLR